MTSVTMKPKDWTLLTIAAGSDPLTPAQLQKSLFLLGQNMPDAVGKDFYEFRPYHYGPFCSRIYLDADEMAGEGAVALIKEAGVAWKSYAVTPAGHTRAEETAKTADADALAYLKKVVAWAQGLSFQDLVRAIYKQYPEYRARSVFKD